MAAKKKKTAEKKPETKEIRTVVRELQDYELELLAKKAQAIEIAKSSYHDVLYTLVGPEHIQNRTLQINPQMKRIEIIVVETGEES